MATENQQLAEPGTYKELRCNNLNDNDCQRCSSDKIRDGATCGPHTHPDPPADPKFGPGCGDCNHSCHCSGDGYCPTCGHDECAHYAL